MVKFAPPLIILKKLKSLRDKFFFNNRGYIIKTPWYIIGAKLVVNIVYNPDRLTPLPSQIFFKSEIPPQKK